LSDIDSMTIDVADYVTKWHCDCTKFKSSLIVYGGNYMHSSS